MENRLRECREAKNISQVKLSEISGISRPTIIKIESGENVEVKASTLVKLAEALDTTVTEIFFCN